MDHMELAPLADVAQSLVEAFAADAEKAVASGAVAGAGWALGRAWKFLRECFGRTEVLAEAEKSPSDASVQANLVKALEQLLVANEALARDARELASRADLGSINQTVFGCNNKVVLGDHNRIR